MAEPATRQVIEALEHAGASPRFVGGCVRDAVLGRPVKDIDIATPAAPEFVMGVLAEAGMRAIPTGIAHGTVTAVVAGHHFEITTLRRDVETDGRRAVVAFTDDWAADAARRDFTFNALFCDSDGTLYDPTGGLADLKAGRVRFVGNARQRIEEDVLRLLRFFRFTAYYGAAPPDAEALAACRAMAPRLPSLSAERVHAELSRIFCAPDPAAVLRLMAEAGVLGVVLEEARRVERLARLTRREASLGRAPDFIRRLAAAIELSEDGALAMAHRLRLSNAERERLATLVAHEGDIHPTMTALAKRTALHRLGGAMVADLALIGWAGKDADRDDPDWRGLIAEADGWTPKHLPVTGNDALARGVERGPALGDLLRRLEEWWIAENFAPDRMACLEKLGSLTGDMPPEGDQS